MGSAEVAVHQQPPTSPPNHKEVTRRCYAFHPHNANGSCGFSGWSAVGFRRSLEHTSYPALLALEAASESVGVCAKQGYLETAVVVDADGATIVALRGDGAGIHTLDSAHDKAYTSVSFKNDTIALEERGRVEIAPLSKLPHVMFFGGGVVIKLGDETIGAIGASGAPGAKLDDACARAGLDRFATG